MEDTFKFQIMLEAGTHIKYVKLTDIVKHLDAQIKAIDSDDIKEVLEHIRSEYIKLL
jgi:L-arabinose isomerase